MKKSLMILASVALGASMASAADVTSKNVVGFSKESLTANNWKQQALQFDKVGGGTNTLADLPINPATSDGTVIQIASFDGIKVQFSSYTCYAEDPNFGGGPAGWYDAGSVYAGNVKIPTGSGFWLIPSMTANVSFAGEVVAADMQVNLVANAWKMLGNPYPVAIKLAELPIVPASSDGTVVQVAFFDGIKVQFNSYTCYAEDPNFGGGPAGWYDAGSAYAGDTIIPVGQGFWLIPSFTGAITFVSPL